MFVYRVMRFRLDRLTIKPLVIALTGIVVLFTTCLFVLQRNRPEAPIAVRFVGYTNSVLGPNALFRVQNPSDGPIHVGDWDWQTEDGGIANAQCIGADLLPGLLGSAIRAGMMSDAPRSLPRSSLSRRALSC